MSIPENPAAGSQRGGRGLSGKGTHRFIGDEVAPANVKNESESPTVKAVKLGERVPVSKQVSASYSSTDRTAALYMRILVVREMDCWRHNVLRSTCITFDDSARLRSISGLSSPLLVTVEPRYTNESANSTAFPSTFRDGGSGPSPHASVLFSPS